MGESTSVFIWRVVKLKCAYGDLRILTISRVKRIIKYFFVSILFRNLVRSIHPTTCRSMFSEANMCTRCQKWWKLLWIGRIPALYIWEVQSSLNFFFFFKCHDCQRAMSFPSPLTKMWKTNGSGFRRWMQSEYRFDIGVESSMSWGLQMKNLKLSTKKPMKRRKELGSGLLYFKN